RSEIGDFDDLAAFLSGHAEVDTHLVLPASTKVADLKRIQEDYEVFHPARIIFTRLDETDTYGALLALSVSSGKPISFLSTGQRIPEDLRPASRELVGQLFRLPNGVPRRSASAVAA